MVVNVLLSSSSDVCVLSLWLADFALARARTKEPCKCINAPLSQELYTDVENAPYLSLAPSLQYFSAITLRLCRPTLKKGKLARAQASENIDSSISCIFPGRTWALDSRAVGMAWTNQCRAESYPVRGIEPVSIEVAAEIEVDYRYS
jgi:hypothetical protein